MLFFYLWMQYFRRESDPIEGALECRMVSTTSVERPESMSRAHSEAKSTVSTVLVGGEISSTLLGTEGPSWPGAPEERNHTLPGHRGAMRSSRTRSRRTLPRTPGSRAIGGNAYRRSLGHVCTIVSSPEGAGCMRENQSGQWDISRDANRCTCAWPNSLHISATTSRWSLHSPGLSPCLDRMSSSTLWTPGM